LKTNDLTDWTAISSSKTELNNDLRSTGKVITISTEKVGIGSIGATQKLSIDWALIAENDTSVAVQFLLYINDINFMKDSDGNLLGGTVSFLGSMVSYKWDISDLQLKTGWNRILLNFRTSEGYNLNEEDLKLKDLKIFKIEIKKPDNVTELVIGLDKLEIATLSVSERNEQEAPAPNDKTYDKGTLIIAFIVAVLIIILVFAEAIHFSMKEKSRLRKLRTEKRRKRLAEKSKKDL
ncbi:MAG: hypothetical protein K0S55_2081, partial [Clostridia bacterium]|nr:hypothetical protein [Clostridia bacterium]